ncbi:hypothetical protein NQ318_020604 [Aromia moschata]|uniref:Uncharacterized protein n=1 Tax=Aromia moschata TaxID=1265417 RepID=A0AAV8Z219_9CUCU|nr:hypothetical protein NQ318_020604 [Aromia moschata]
MFVDLGNLEILNVSNNDVSYLSPNCFYDLPKIEKLFLEDNNLSHLPRALFRDSILSELHLEGNQINVLRRTVFLGLSNLRFLYLNNNKISKLQSDCFYKLFELTILFLQNNEIEYLSQDVFNGLDNLIELRLDNNSLGSIELNTFHNMCNLQSLNVSDTHLNLDVSEDSDHEGFGHIAAASATIGCNLRWKSIRTQSMILMIRCGGLPSFLTVATKISHVISAIVGLDISAMYSAEVSDTTSCMEPRALTSSSLTSSVQHILNSVKKCFATETRASFGQGWNQSIVQPDIRAGKRSALLRNFSPT